MLSSITKVTPPSLVSAKALLTLVPPPRPILVHTGLGFSQSAHTVLTACICHLTFSQSPACHCTTSRSVSLEGRQFSLVLRRSIELINCNLLSRPWTPRWFLIFAVTDNTEVVIFMHETLFCWIISFRLIPRSGTAGSKGCTFPWVQIRLLSDCFPGGLYQFALPPQSLHNNQLFCLTIMPRIFPWSPEGAKALI